MRDGSEYSENWFAALRQPALLDGLQGLLRRRRDGVDHELRAALVLEDGVHLHARGPGPVPSQRVRRAPEDPTVARRERRGPQVDGAAPAAVRPGKT